MIKSLPKYVSPCNGVAGSDCDRASLSSKHHEFELFIARTNCLEEVESPISRCTSEASSWPAHDAAEAFLQISYAAPEEQSAAPSPSMTSDGKGSEMTELIPRKVSTRKIHPQVLGMEAGLTSELSDALGAKTSTSSITKGHKSTKRKTTYTKPPVKLKPEQKRKSCLEKNRVAAASCRLKRQRRESELQTHSHELASSNSTLKKVVSGMQEEVQKLKSMLSIHLLNGCHQVSTGLGEEFTEGGLDDYFQQMECSSENSSETMASLYSESYNMEFGDDHDMFLHDGDLEDVSPFDSYLLT